MLLMCVHAKILQSQSLLTLWGSLFSITLVYISALLSDRTVLYLQITLGAGRGTTLHTWCKSFLRLSQFLSHTK